jgi:hypothetical protein
MKSILSKFADNVLSKSEMKTLRGGNPADPYELGDPDVTGGGGGGVKSYCRITCVGWGRSWTEYGYCAGTPQQCFGKRTAGTGNGSGLTCVNFECSLVA